MCLCIHSRKRFELFQYIGCFWYFVILVDVGVKSDKSKRRDDSFVNMGGWVVLIGSCRIVPNSFWNCSYMVGKGFVKFCI